MKMLTHYYQPVGYNENNTKKEVYSNDFLSSKDMKISITKSSDSLTTEKQ